MSSIKKQILKIGCHLACTGLQLARNYYPKQPCAIRHLPLWGNLPCWTWVYNLTYSLVCQLFSVFILYSESGDGQ